MNDLPTMCVLDCLADFAKELQYFVDRVCAFANKVSKTPALDIFHDKPWGAVQQSASIVEPRYIRMV